MENLNPHLAKAPRFEPISYTLEDDTVVTTKAVIITGILKTVSNKTRLMKNKKQTPFRVATVQSWNPHLKALEIKPAQLIDALYESISDSFQPESEVEIMLQYDAETKRTYGKVQLPALESFDFTQYAPKATAEVAETA